MKTKPEYHILQLISDGKVLSSGRFLATLIVFSTLYNFFKHPENLGLQNIVMAEAGMAFAAYTASKFSKEATVKKKEDDAPLPIQEEA